MKVISLGAGVQSTTMYLMSCAGEIDKANVAIFADTGWEPKAVYEHLGRLRDFYEENKEWAIPIKTVSKGNLRDDFLKAVEDNGFATMPLFAKDPQTQKVSMLRRQCTREYKIAELQREMRLMGAKGSDPFEVWIGISVDEAMRMKASRVKYTVHRWPLIEQRMTRHDCRIYLEKAGWDVPKSSCIGCPFHTDHWWADLKQTSPEEFQDAVEFDRAIRHLPRLHDETFLHNSALPLDEVIFDDESQFDLFGNECEGMCGV